MKAQNFTIIQADLIASESSGDAEVVDMLMNYVLLDDKGAIVETQELYPKEVFMYNDTSVDIEVLPISDPKEFADFEARPSYYDLVRVPSGFAYSNDGKFDTCYKFLVRALDSGVTKDLRIDFYAYSRFK